MADRQNLGLDETVRYYLDLHRDHGYNIPVWVGKMVGVGNGVGVGSWGVVGQNLGDVWGVGV